MAQSLFVESLVVIAASACAVGLVRRAGLSPIVGYLAAGLVIGPHGLAILAPSHGTEFLSELGVVLLMFMVGLEFSLTTMMAARATVLGAGGLQVGLTTAAGASAAHLLGMGWQAAVVTGAVLAMSSTAITLKQLSDDGQLASQHGRLAAGILLFQDLAALPFLVLVGTGQDGEAGAMTLLLQLLIAAAAFVLIAVAGGPVFRAALSWAAGTRSPELFLLASLLLALGTAMAANAAGLSPPLGAFLAGMVVGESDFRHRIEDDIRPFRDVLVGLFFVTVGMQLDPGAAITAPLAVLGWGLAFLLGKPLLLGLTALVLRWPAAVGIRVAIILAHGGEFGLLLLTQAIGGGIIDREAGYAMLVALALSMGIAPILIQRSGALAELLGVALASDRDTSGDARELHDHVVLCGCGRVGRLIASALDAARIAYVGLESDLARFREAKRAGHHVLFGDATRGNSLERVGINRARLLVVTFDQRQAVAKLLHEARHRNPATTSIVSAADDRELSALTEAGATIVFPENLAAGLSLADQVLLLSGLSQEQAASVITELRAELNPELQGRVGL